MYIKRKVLLSLMLSSLILTVKAQWNIDSDNWSTGNLTLRNIVLAPNAGSKLEFTSYGDSYPGPHIRSNLHYASISDTRSSLILSSYFNGYKDELRLSNGQVLISNKLSLLNYTNAPNAGGELEFTSYSDSYPGPRIRSNLYMASENDTRTSLILSSYSNGYKDELKLFDGKVGIMCTPQYELDVCGTIRAREITVNLQGGCDFVFKSDYKLMELDKLDAFVRTNQHLPEIAPEKEMVENGINMKEFQMKLLQKIEELTLYTIEQDKAIEELKQAMKLQNEKIEKLESTMK